MTLLMLSNCSTPTTLSPQACLREQMCGRNQLVSKYLFKNMYSEAVLKSKTCLYYVILTKLSFKNKVCLNLLNWISHILGILMYFPIFSTLFSADARALFAFHKKNNFFHTWSKSGKNFVLYSNMYT